MAKFESEARQMTEPKFEIFKDKAGMYRFRIVAPNGEIIAVSEPYATKEGCVNGINFVVKNVPKAVVKNL